MRWLWVKSVFQSPRKIDAHSAHAASCQAETWSMIGFSIITWKLVWKPPKLFLSKSGRWWCFFPQTMAIFGSEVFFDQADPWAPTVDSTPGPWDRWDRDPWFDIFFILTMATMVSGCFILNIYLGNIWTNISQTWIVGPWMGMISLSHDSARENRVRSL